MREQLLHWAEGFADRRTFLALAAVVFAVVLIDVPPTGLLSSNEEQYLAIAARWFDVHLLPAHSFILGGMPHAILYSAIGGPLVAAFGFETAQIIGRLGVALAYAFALARLFRVLELRAVDVAIVLLAFVGLDEATIGGENLFVGFEPKTIAYPLVILALADTLEGRFKRAYAWLAPAAYAHFLVACAWAGFIGLCALWNGRRPREVLVPAGWFVASILPLVVYLYLSSYGDFAGAARPGEPSIGWILAFLRVPHHTNPFLTHETLVIWAPGILTVAAFFLIALFMERRASEPARTLIRLSLLAHGWLLAILPLVYLDTRGFLAEFYVFRPATLGLLMALTIGALSIRRYAAQYATPAALAAFVVLAATVLSSMVWQLPKERRIVTARLEKQAPLGRFIREHTGSDDSFVVEGPLEADFLGFERRFNRPLYFLDKFIPAKSTDIYLWYRRRVEVTGLYEHGCTGAGAGGPRYAIASTPAARKVLSTCGTPVFNDGNYAIWKIS